MIDYVCLCAMGSWQLRDIAFPMNVDIDEKLKQPEREEPLCVCFPNLL